MPVNGSDPVSYFEGVLELGGRPAWDEAGDDQAVQGVGGLQAVQRVVGLILKVTLLSYEGQKRCFLVVELQITQKKKYHNLIKFTRKKTRNVNPGGGV